MEEKKPAVQKKPEKRETESLVRILSTDIPGSRNLYSGLKKIKGVSFPIAKAVSKQTGIPLSKRVGELSKEEISVISDAIKNPIIPAFMMNRRSDFETGKTLHLITTDLDLTKEFDIKRMKKMRSYKGIRHASGLPVRGQRTKSHFRKKGKNKAVGVSKTKTEPAPAKGKEGGKK